MIAERGLEGLSLRALARRLGATTGLVTHHFLDRAELIEAALDHASAVMERRLARLDDRTDPIAILEAVLPTDGEAVQNWRFSAAVRSASLGDPSLRRFQRAMADSWQQGFPLLIGDRVEGDPQVATRHVMLLIDAIALHAVIDPERWPPGTQLEHLHLGLAGLGLDRR